jgi:UDP-N-acetyl-alpha-D-quinovosamine dehydrogenase
MAGASSEAVAGGRVVVTGAGGFIGRALTAYFAATGRDFSALVRHDTDAARPHAKKVADLASAREEDLAALLGGADAVVHLAARTHGSAGSMAEYTSANVAATAALARAAVRAGVSRFVLASTVKVNGESTERSRPFEPDDIPEPADAYAISKLEAERELSTIASGTPMAPIILRLPLVYGPGVKGHFATLIDEIARGRSLPLGAIDNRRSVLYVSNLVEAIESALNAREAPAGVHFVADANPVSVPDLARAIGHVLGVPVQLRSVPVRLLEFGGRITGRSALVQRLVSSLEVDSSSFTLATGWLPAYTLWEGLSATARWWRLHHAI